MLYLSEGPVLGNAHKGQALLQAQSALRALNYVHKVDIAISHLLHLDHTACVLIPVEAANQEFDAIQ